MTFDSSYYVQAHGKAPRGEGYWAFCPLSKYRMNNYLDYTMFFAGTIAEAKAQAREHFAGLANVVEDTKKAALAKMYLVEPCGCQECKRMSEAK